MSINKQFGLFGVNNKIPVIVIVILFSKLVSKKLINLSLPPPTLTFPPLIWLTTWSNTACKLGPNLSTTCSPQSVTGPKAVKQKALN